MRHYIVFIYFMVFLLSGAPSARAVFFASDKIEIYSNGRPVTDNTMVMEHQEVVELCEKGICILPQQYGTEILLYRLKEPWTGYENFIKSQKSQALSFAVKLPDPQDRSVHHTDPNAPIGGMIGAYRCFIFDFQSQQLKEKECASKVTENVSYTLNQLSEIQPQEGIVYITQGYVVFMYECPPCPRDAMCKPCASEYIIISDDKKRISYPDQMAFNDLIAVVNSSFGLREGGYYQFKLKASAVSLMWLGEAGWEVAEAKKTVEPSKAEKNKKEKMCCENCLQFAKEENSSCRELIIQNGGTRHCSLVFSGDEPTVNQCRKILKQN